MLEVKTKIKHIFDFDFKLKYDTIHGCDSNQYLSCYCEKEFRADDEKKPKAKDHCQLTGKFSGLAHENCN